MPNIPIKPPPNPLAWLWKLALAIVFVAASIIALMTRDLPDPDTFYNIRRVMAITLVLLGIVAISGMSRWWIRR